MLKLILVITVPLFLIFSSMFQIRSYAVEEKEAKEKQEQQKKVKNFFSTSKGEEVLAKIVLHFFKQYRMAFMMREHLNDENLKKMKGFCVEALNIESFPLDGKDVKVELKLKDTEETKLKLDDNVEILLFGKFFKKWGDIKWRINEDEVEDIIDAFLTR